MALVWHRVMFVITVRHFGSCGVLYISCGCTVIMLLQFKRLRFGGSFRTIQASERS